MPLTVPNSTSFVFIDERPAEQRVSRPPTPSDQESYFGDDAITPPAVDIVRTLLERRAANALRGKTVRLTDLVVSVKDPAVAVNGGALNASSASVPGGAAVAPIAGLLILGIEKTRSQKWVYVRIGGSVDDKEFSAYQNDGYRGRVTEANVLTTLMAVVEAAARDAEQVALAQ